MRCKLIKRERGITLVALIITIIILIILVAVSLNVVFGEGLLEIAIKGTDNYVTAQGEDIKTFEEAGNTLEKIESSIKNREENKDSNLNLEFTVTEQYNYEIEKGIKEIYIIFSTGTNEYRLQPVVTGEIVESYEEIAFSTRVDNYGEYLRADLKVLKVKLTGERGTINVSVNEGSGKYRAWTTILGHLIGENNEELKFIDSNPNYYEIEEGIKEVYIIYGTGTNNHRLQPVVTGEIVESYEEVAYSTRIDNYGEQLRADLKVLKVKLTGERGTVNASVNGGSGEYRAWTTIGISK